MAVDGQRECHQLPMRDWNIKAVIRHQNNLCDGWPGTATRLLLPWAIIKQDITRQCNITRLKTTALASIPLISLILLPWIKMFFLFLILYCKYIYPKNCDQCVDLGFGLWQRRPRWCAGCLTFGLPGSVFILLNLWQSHRDRQAA